MANKTFERELINDIEGINEEVISEMNLQFEDLVESVGLSFESSTVSLNGNDLKSEIEESISLFDKASDDDRDEEFLKASKSIGQYCAMPFTVDYIQKGEDSDPLSDDFSIVVRNEYIMRSCIRDFSDKILIISKDFVNIYKSISDLNTRKCLVFVVDHYVLEQIINNQYNLDDLQYSIAKAIGIKPKHLKITNVINNLKESYEDFNKIRLTFMTDRMEYNFFPKNNINATIKTIQVKTDESEPIDVVIENYSRGIRWLGGYRHCKTGILYCNASTQTGPHKVDEEHFFISLVSKDTQTHLPIKDKGINMPVDHSTQMCRSDHYMPSDTDRVINSGVYKEYNDSNKVDAAITIQKHWRGMKVRKYELPKIIENRIRKEIILEKTESRFDQENTKILNMLFPYKRRHFDNLYNILFKLQQDLNRKLPEIKLDAVRKTYNIEVMEKEIAAAKSIDKERELVRKGMRERAFLEFSSSPTIKYKSDKNCIYLVENTATTKYKQFKELFILFCREDVSVNQRIEIILLFRDLMESVEYFEMKDELIELLNRECILLSSGVPSKYLRALRKRCQAIAINCIRSLDISDRLQAKKSGGALQQIYRCKSCSKFKHINEFYLSVNQNTIRNCKSCVNILRSCHSTLNYSYFDTLLQYLRKDEYSKNCASPYLLLLHPKGLEYIIIKIWGGQSIISYEKVLARLRLPRWDNRLPWTPWNCILITEEEEKHHKTIENVYEFYSNRICDIIKLKHLRAIEEFERIFNVEYTMRNLFSQLSQTEWKLNKTMLMRAFNEIGENFFNPPPHKHK